MNFSTPQLHVFAGPNGSGKSTMIRELRLITKVGYYVNADDIEKNLHENKYLNLAFYGIWPAQDQWTRFLEESTLAAKIPDQFLNLVFKNNVIVAGAIVAPYDAALLAEFLRCELLRDHANFAFETVMSHPSKLEFLQQAKQAGYETHLHFVSTESPIINQERVLSRVAKGGHSVDPVKITDRWYRSMELLHQMIPHADHCYLYDNSKDMRLFIYIEKGVKIRRMDRTTLPAWYKQYVTGKGIRNKSRK